MRVVIYWTSAGVRKRFDTESNIAYTVSLKFILGSIDKNEVKLSKEDNNGAVSVPNNQSEII